MTAPGAVRLKIVAYSDYVCPWCYIALHRIERLQAEYPVDVEWRPFELHPETPKSGAHWLGRLGSERRISAYTNNILMLAHDSDIPMAMPEVIANSHLALEASEYARESGGFEALHHALFAAYFDEGRNISDIDVICDVARACGVDDQGLRQALTDETYAARVDASTAAARCGWPAASSVTAGLPTRGRRRGSTPRATRRTSSTTGWRTGSAACRPGATSSRSTSSRRWSRTC